jgi:hypothetical protein
MIFNFLDKTQLKLSLITSSVVNTMLFIFSPLAFKLYLLLLVVLVIPFYAIFSLRNVKRKTFRISYMILSPIFFIGLYINMVMSEIHRGGLFDVTAIILSILATGVMAIVFRIFSFWQELDYYEKGK